MRSTVLRKHGTETRQTWRHQKMTLETRMAVACTFRCFYSIPKWWGETDWQIDLLIFLGWVAQQPSLSSLVYHRVIRTLHLNAWFLVLLPEVSIDIYISLIQLARFVGVCVMFMDGPSICYYKIPDVCCSIQIFCGRHMKVSWNRSTPKSSILIGFSPINHL